MCAGPCTANDRYHHHPRANRRQKCGAQPSASSATVRDCAEFNPANGFDAPQPRTVALMRTVGGQPSRSGTLTVRTNPLDSAGGTAGTVRTQISFPIHAPRNPRRQAGARGWRRGRRLRLRTRRCPRRAMTATIWCWRHQHRRRPPCSICCRHKADIMTMLRSPARELPRPNRPRHSRIWRT
jgi:hypothetical protein